MSSSGFIDKVKDKVPHVAHDVAQAAGDAIEDIKELAHDPKSRLSRHKEQG